MPLLQQDVNLMTTHLIPPFVSFINTQQYNDWHQDHLQRIGAFQAAINHTPLTLVNIRQALNHLYAFQTRFGAGILNNNLNALQNAFGNAGMNPNIANRYNDLYGLNGVGPSIASEILHRLCPNQCAFLSIQVRKVIHHYPWSNAFPVTIARLRGDVNANDYASFCELVGGVVAPSVISVLAASPALTGLFNGATDYEIADTFFRFWSLKHHEIIDRAVRQLKSKEDSILGVKH